MDVNELQAKTAALFREAFGRTSLKDRTDDILNEAIEVNRFVDLDHLKEELGDLAASLLTACEELGVSFQDLVEQNHEKIIRRKAQYQSMGRKLNVALLGGSFDPIHDGHIGVAKTILKMSREFDEVWLVPCNNSLHGKKLESGDHRIAMCEAAITDPRIKVFDYEIKNDLGGSTLNLINRLNDDPAYKDQYSFAFIIGADNALNTHEWVGWEELERRCQFVVVPRPGQVIAPGMHWFLKAPHIFLDPEEQDEISSTSIRHSIANDPTLEEASHWLDPKVLHYITQNNLYGFK